MMNIPLLVQEFSKIEISKKKEKLLLMLEQIKESDSMFLDLIQIITTKEDLDESFLTGIYQDILELGDAIANYNLANKEKILSSLQEKLKEMHEREARERVIEQQEVDELIKNI